MKIALLEDELMLRSSIEEYLEAQNHQIFSFGAGDKARDILLKEQFDLFIFDINIPKIDGFELLKSLKESGINTPVIYISALVDIEEITKAYELGAADYIKKPFHLKELSLRINRVANLIDDNKRRHILLSENYSYSKEKELLLFDAKAVELTKKQLYIIKLLSSNVDNIVTFDMLREYVWGSEPVDNSTIRAEISRLRGRLKEDFIKSVKGVGYKIIRYRK